MNTCRWVCVEVYVSYNFVNMIFAVKIIQEDLLSWKLHNRIFFFILTYVPWMNNFLVTENNFLPRYKKTGKLQFSTLFLPRCLYLEYQQYKNPPKEYN